MHMEVKSGGGREWALTAVYANPHSNARRLIWERLDALEVRKLWVLIGDFNCVLKDEERSSGLGASSALVSWVRRNCLIDLGYGGNRYTWRYGVSKETRKAARLDGALCCDN